MIELTAKAKGIISRLKEEKEALQNELNNLLLGAVVTIPYGPYKGYPATICEVEVRYFTVVVNIHRKDGKGYLNQLNTHHHRYYPISQFVKGVKEI